MLFSKQIEGIYAKTLLTRNDNAQGFFYFSPEDFPGLQAWGYDFPARAGHTLCGFFYGYSDPDPDRLLVFDHGMGNGHRAYMVEIERLARAGYLVYSYDHTGCMASGGEHIGGFAQSLSDLDDCIKALKKEPALNERAISVMGHSWGGFSAMNIAALHPDITHVVAISGFLSVEQILRQYFAGPLGLYIPDLLEAERRANPGYADCNAVDGLKKTTANVLLICSDNDKTVRKDLHHDQLYRALVGRRNIQFLTVSGKGHNPSYTADAVGYKDVFWKEAQKAGKKGLLATPEQQKAFMDRYDWHRMTCQDEAVWKQILRHLENRDHIAQP